MRCVVIARRLTSCRCSLPGHCCRWPANHQQAGKEENGKARPVSAIMARRLAAYRRSARTTGLTAAVRGSRPTVARTG